MNYSNPISLRLLSICDARYKSNALSDNHIVPQEIIAKFWCKPQRRPRNNKPATLAHGGSRVSSRSSGDRLFVTAKRILRRKHFEVIMRRSMPKHYGFFVA